MQINFIEPKIEAFCTAIQHFIETEVKFDIALVGNNHFANEISYFLNNNKIVFNQQQDIAAKSSILTVIILTESNGELLSMQLMKCIDLSNVIIIAPITDYHSSKNPLFLISIPKSGTHLIYELAKALGYFPGVELIDNAKPQRWYCVEYSNSHTVARDFFVDTVRRSIFGNRHHAFMRSPAIFIYRHPLDILLSEAHYYHKDGKTAFAGWFEGMDFEERISKLFDDNWLLGSLRDRIGGFLPWLRLPNVIPVSFEELIGSVGGGDDLSQVRVIWSIMLKLHVSGSPTEIASKIFNPDSPTFRSAKIGSFIDNVPESIQKRFFRENQDILLEFGYETDGKIGLPNRSKEFLYREFKKSKNDFLNMPLTIKKGFFECNLVLFNNRYYALPCSAGAIRLEKLSTESLKKFPQADSLETLKALLLLGAQNFKENQSELIAFGQTLANDMPSTRTFYWDYKTTILCVYQGFNVLSYKGSFLALKQSLGEINLINSTLEDIVIQYGSNNVIYASSIVQVYHAIDLQISLDSIVLYNKQNEEALNQCLELLKKNEEYNEIKILREYKGFNVLSYEGSFLALKQSLGEVNLINSTLEDIVIQYGSNNVIYASSIVQVYHAIDLQISLDSIVLYNKQNEEALNQCLELLKKNEEYNEIKIFINKFLKYFKRK